MGIDNVDSIAAAGLRAQATRLRIITENVANAQSTGANPEREPYRRKVVTFANVLDRESGIKTVQVTEVRPSPAEFPKRYDPGHPSAKADGYVLLPNVNVSLEMADMKQAHRSYQANLQVIEATDSMTKHLDAILRD